MLGFPVNRPAECRMQRSTVGVCEGGDESPLVTTSQEGWLQCRVRMGRGKCCPAQPGHSQDQPGAVTPLQLAKAWLAVFLVSHDSEGLTGGDHGQGQSALFLQRAGLRGETRGHRKVKGQHQLGRSARMCPPVNPMGLNNDSCTLPQETLVFGTRLLGRPTCAQKGLCCYILTVQSQ